MSDPRRLRVLELLRSYGWNATSFQVLEPGLSYWFAPERDAAVAYVEAGGYWMAAGAPICAPQRLAGVAEAFVAAAAAAGRRAAFFGATARLLEALGGWDWLQVGVQACWDPRLWRSRTEAGSSVPSQVRRAARKGVGVREVPPAELAAGRPLRAEAEQLVEAWLAGHPMAPMQFMVDLDAFNFASERRYWVAQREGRLVGMLVAVPIYARGGWFLEDLVYLRNAPNGTSEALVDACMRALAQDGVSYATMGLVALAGLGQAPSTPLGEQRPGFHPWLTLLLRRSYDSLNGLYGFRGVHAFRARLKPTEWEPVYLCAPGRVTARTLAAVLDAFAGGRPDRFVLTTGHKFLHRLLARVPAARWEAVCTFLAWALIPWIGMLILADGQRWFGAWWLGKAWASFDVVVAGAFSALARGIRERAEWRRPCAHLLLGVVLADCWMTTAQALLFNLPHAVRPFDLLLVGIAVTAPYSAAAYLSLLLGYGPMERGRI